MTDLEFDKELNKELKKANKEGFRQYVIEIDKSTNLEHIMGPGVSQDQFEERFNVHSNLQSVEYDHAPNLQYIMETTPLNSSAKKRLLKIYHFYLQYF